MGLLSEYPSLTGFPLIPYYSCQSPLVILLITLLSHSSKTGSSGQYDKRDKKLSSLESQHHPIGCNL